MISTPVRLRRCLTKSGPMTLSEASRTLNLSVARVRAALQTLKRQGVATLNGEGLIAITSRNDEGLLVNLPSTREPASTSRKVRVATEDLSLIHI